MRDDPNLQLPQPPQYAEEEISRFKSADDFMPLMFEWYKYIGVLAAFCAGIVPESAAVKPTINRTYAVLVGLLNRCAKLMLANVALSHEGKFGEAVSILDRCIHESAANIRWICDRDSDERAKRFVVTGLGADVQFKAIVEGNISRRSGIRRPIEDSMLASIDQYVADGEVSFEEIASTKKMPNFKQVYLELGHSELDYAVHQGLGSHHVHGTWPGLLTHYLRRRAPGQLGMDGLPSEPHINQYMSVGRAVAGATSAYVSFLLVEEVQTELLALIASCDAEMFELYKRAAVFLDAERSIRSSR